jgi:hypothetical protein
LEVVDGRSIKLLAAAVWFSKRSSLAVSVPGRSGRPGTPAPSENVSLEKRRRETGLPNKRLYPLYRTYKAE